MGVNGTEEASRPIVPRVALEKHISTLIDGIERGDIVSIQLNSLASGKAVDVLVTKKSRFQLKTKV